MVNNKNIYFKNIPDYHVGDVVTTGSENGLSEQLQISAIIKKINF